MARDAAVAAATPLEDPGPIIHAQNQQKDWTFMNKRFTRILATSIAAAALMGSLAACGKGSASATSEGGNEITMWTHNAGNPGRTRRHQGDR